MASDSFSPDPKRSARPARSDGLYEQVRRAGATIRVEIGDRPYGLRDFSIEDDSGNRLDFGEPIEDLGARDDAALP